jgi:hypothetical protein
MRNPDGSPEIDIDSLPIGNGTGGFEDEAHKASVAQVFAQTEHFTRRERPFSQLDATQMPVARLNALRELYAVPLRHSAKTSRQLEDEGALKIADALRRQDR